MHDQEVVAVESEVMEGEEESHSDRVLNRSFELSWVEESHRHRGTECRWLRRVAADGEVQRQNL